MANTIIAASWVFFGLVFYLIEICHQWEIEKIKEQYWMYGYNERWGKPYAPKCKKCGGENEIEG